MFGVIQFKKHCISFQHKAKKTLLSKVEEKLMEKLHLFHNFLTSQKKHTHN
jgi:hypothetical protein